MPTAKFGPRFTPKFGRPNDAPAAQVAASDASAAAVAKPAARMTIGDMLRRPSAKPQVAEAPADTVTVDTILAERMESGLRKLGREADPYLAHGKLAARTETVAEKSEPPTVYDSDGAPIVSLHNIDGQVELYASRGETWDLEDANGNPMPLQLNDLAHRQWHDFTPEEQDALRARFPNAPEKKNTGPQNTGGIGRVADLIQAGLVTPNAPGVPGRPIKSTE